MRSPTSGAPLADGPSLHPDPGRGQQSEVEPPQMSLHAIVCPQASLAAEPAGQVPRSATHSWSPHVGPSTRRPKLYPPEKPCSSRKTVVLIGRTRFGSGLPGLLQIKPPHSPVWQVPLPV